jgi:hypothetical protein
VAAAHAAEIVAQLLAHQAATTRSISSRIARVRSRFSAGVPGSAEGSGEEEADGGEAFAEPLTGARADMVGGRPPREIEHAMRAADADNG